MMCSTQTLIIDVVGGKKVGIKRKVRRAHIKNAGEITSLEVIHGLEVTSCAGSDNTWLVVDPADRAVLGHIEFDVEVEGKPYIPFATKGFTKLRYENVKTLFLAVALIKNSEGI